MATIILANSDSDTDYGTDSDCICHRHLRSGRRSKARIGDRINRSPDFYRPLYQYRRRGYPPSPIRYCFRDDGNIMFAPSAGEEHRSVSSELEPQSRGDSTLPYPSHQLYNNGDQKAADYSCPAELSDRGIQFAALEAEFEELEQKDRSARAMLYALIDTTLETPEAYSREKSRILDSTLSQLQRLSMERTELISGVKDAMIATFFKKVTSRDADPPEAEETGRHSTEPEALKTASKTTKESPKPNDRSGWRRTSRRQPASDSERSDSPPTMRKPKSVRTRKSRKPAIQHYED